MSALDGLTCDVCGRKPVIGVASSGLGPMSNAYCQECASNYAEPAWMLDFTWDNCDGQVADWVRNICTWKDGGYVSFDEYIGGRAPKPIMYDEGDMLPAEGEDDEIEISEDAVLYPSDKEEERNA